MADPDPDPDRQIPGRLVEEGWEELQAAAPCGFVVGVVPANGTRAESANPKDNF